MYLLGVLVEAGGMVAVAVVGAAIPTQKKTPLLTQEHSIQLKSVHQGMVQLVPLLHGEVIPVSSGLLQMEETQVRIVVAGMVELGMVMEEKAAQIIPVAATIMETLEPQGPGLYIVLLRKLSNGVEVEVADQERLMVVALVAHPAEGPVEVQTYRLPLGPLAAEEVAVAGMVLRLPMGQMEALALSLPGFGLRRT